MDLTTRYLGLHLSHPLMPGASPMVDDLDTVRRLEDAGASAIVMHSLFEEQITQSQLHANGVMEALSHTSAEALSYFPQAGVFALGPERYLEQIRRIRAAVSIPVIASLNGVTVGGWLEYARLMEQAGAHALELNVYAIPTDPDVDAASVEDRVVEIVREVRAAVRIRFAVKLSPFYSSLPHFMRRLEEAGADGAVLFNRFYQADIDPEALEVSRSLHLSDSSDLLLRLRWLAILSGRTNLTLAASGGVHTSIDAIKSMMAGARAVQLSSALLRHGPMRLRVILDEVRAWLVEHEYDSISQLTGSMNLSRCPDPAAFERGNYVQILQSWTTRPH